MKNLILIAAAYLLSVGNIASSQNNGKLNIVVTDQNQKPMESTFVELLDAKDSSLVQFSTTGKDGNIEFNGLKNGKYIVFVPESGYTNYTSNLVTISHTGEEYSLSVILSDTKSHNVVIVLAHPVFYSGKVTISSRA
jgi:uncharacterized surface anchored protein